ncbi:MAG: acetyl-CoA carboxylase, carboxyltransferase subunit beta [Erysipelotrichaceae bacterium]
MFKKLQDKKLKVNALRSGNVMESVVEIPAGMYDKCPSCDLTLETAKLQLNKWVCPNCNYHYRLHVAERAFVSFDTFKVFNHDVRTLDPLEFPGYLEKLADLIEKLGVYNGVITGEATINGYAFIGIIMDHNFMMGSMGSVVGEKITRAFEKAMKQKKPVILFSASGGARMQEGIISLMQMAKTSGVVGKFSQMGGLFINVLTDPTTGGVTASFAMLADIILAEPGALIAFAGPRVIEQTMKEPLPEGFQRAEFLLAKGFVDKIVERADMKSTLEKILELHEVKRWTKE